MSNGVVVKVTDTDLGFRALVASLRRELNGLTISVGIHGDVPGEAESGASMALFASVHEFGSDHVHARPFIRPTFDEHKEKYWRRIRGATPTLTRQPSPPCDERGTPASKARGCEVQLQRQVGRATGVGGVAGMVQVRRGG